ncbi:MAG: restriction endonuclease [Patescibacteria group bacterium]
MKTISVIKANGEHELFSETKVKRSMKHAGIPSEIQKQVMEHVKSKLYDRIPTRKIYRHILEFLDKSEYSKGGKHYRLKQAIMELGPTGYPFEKFVGAILGEYGHKTETGVIVAGKCVSHEIDVVAQKGNKHFMVECKFHNRPGTRSDVKVALYVKARFEDVAAVWREKPGHQTIFHQAWLVTNTKLTSDAIQFGECAGMKLIAWSYPRKGCLQDLIEGTGLHPITCLTSLSRGQKRKLLEQDIVLCRDLIRAETSLLRSLEMSEEKVEQVRREAALTCDFSSKSEDEVLAGK